MNPSPPSGAVPTDASAFPPVADVVTQPKRIQRKRHKGWRMPEGAVYVGRPTKWGNPFRVGTRNALMRVSADGAQHDYHHPGGAVTRCLVRYMTAQEAVDHYRRLVTGDLSPSMRMAGFRPAPWDLSALAGHDLACWCPSWQPCHADVLLELANAGGAS